eukprot:Hpha_TRINITY_DN37408_c0_g1::TRINITY_DN37408_c0_g1_i1::g.115088::m.115088
MPLFSKLARYTLEWCGMIPLAMFNGFLRDVTYKHLIGEWASHQISCIPAFLLFLLYTRYFHGRTPLGSVREAWLVGAYWVFLVTCFETGMTWKLTEGDFETKRSRVLEQYRLDK